MRMIFKIAKTELQSLFYSPMAWLTLVVFTAMIGLVLAPMFENIVINQAMGYGARHVSSVYSQAYASILGYLYLFIPLLTMNVMSRDLSGGTIKLLQSSPLYPSQIILGKYLALMVFGLALMGIFVVYVIFGVFTIQNIDLPYILTGLLGLYLLYCAYVAIGLFVSSLTSYQVVAALGTLAILSVLNYVDMVWQGVDFIRDLTYWLSMKGRVNEFIAGLICSEDVLYFLFVPAMFLMWAILRLRNRIWRGSWSCRWGQYLGVLLTTLVLGYLSSRPVLMCYHDSTREKSQSLAVNTQKIVDLLDGGLTITTYTNVLEDDIFYTLPERINNDKQRFRNFVRFKPETKLEYKYFYADNEKVRDCPFEKALQEQLKWKLENVHPYVVSADVSLVEQITGNDIIRGVTIAANGFYGPQGRTLRLPLYDPELNKKIELFDYDGFRITNFEMESSSLAGLAALMGHRAMTVCCIIAGRVDKNMNTSYKGSMQNLINMVLDRI